MSNKPSPKSKPSPKTKSVKFPNTRIDNTNSTPEFLHPRSLAKDHNLLRYRSGNSKVQAVLKVFGKAKRDGISLSESCLSTPRHNVPDKADTSPRLINDVGPRGDDTPPSPESKTTNMQASPRDATFTTRKCFNASAAKSNRRENVRDKVGKLPDKTPPIRNGPGSPFSSSDSENNFMQKIRAIHNDSRKSARMIRQSRVKLLEIQRKPVLTDADIKEIGHRNEMLLREMERFDRLTKSVQQLVGVEVATQINSKYDRKECQIQTCNQDRDYPAPAVRIPPEALENKLSITNHAITPVHEPSTVRSKSELDLCRKLSESYDMQEKLVADNADLEVKRYVLYKELVTKDQNLETCRAQIKRLQGELKLLNRENALLMEKNSKNSPEGDAVAMKQNFLCTTSCENLAQIDANSETDKEELLSKLENYKCSTAELENQLGGLEFEIQHIRTEMDKMKSCRGGGEKNTCFQQPENAPPVPPLTRACGVCPPCPAPCNPNAPPTPAEKEVARLTTVLRQTEENFKTKVTECAMLRADICKKKEELEKERCLHRECQNKLRELEMKFEGLATHTNMMLGTKEQAFEAEVSVRALKQCYREAREEIDELRLLLKEQNDQLQDYRVKYLQAQQMVEEQRRQMDLMDMDNTRISEQINLEIQKVKIKFQEKLQELAPIPDLLKATQMRLKDAQQSQAIAEHNAEQLARELNCAREKVHMLLHNAVKPPEKPSADKSTDEKQMALLNQRIQQLTEANTAQKGEIERLKASVIRMEEYVLANEKRLQEKMHECAALGGDLDRARDEAARALARANERTETIRKCLQTTVAELERQLAATRAQVASAEKEREELRCRMQCQIKRLNDNFEQAQLRVLGLQTQVETLRHATDAGDGEDVQQECTCKTFFENS